MRAVVAALLLSALAVRGFAIERRILQKGSLVCCWYSWISSPDLAVSPPYANWKCEGRMSWKPWIHGLIAAAVSGAGTGLTGWAVGVSGKQLIAMLAVPMATTVGAYLKQSPIPPEKKGDAL